MNEAEFMAMVDERLSDGKTYPSLDDYTKALHEIAWSLKEQQKSDIMIRKTDKVYGYKDLNTGHDVDIRPVGPEPRARIELQKLVDTGWDESGWEILRTYGENLDGAIRDAKIYRRHQKGRIRLFDTLNGIEITWE